MKTKRHPVGFTMVELIVVTAIVLVLVGMLLPALSRPKGGGMRTRCLNNLIQAGIGFRLYATDGTPYPSFTNQVEVWKNFQTVGREIGSPKVLLCPSDTRSKPALDFESPATTNSFAHESYQNSALSYFYGDGATNEEPNLILAGDRNISTNANILAGPLLVTTNTPVSWTKEMHGTYGNILLADGSAQSLDTKRLRQQIALNTNIAQRFILP